MRLWITTALVAAFLVANTHAIAEGLDDEDSPKKQTAKSILNMITPALKSVCHFEEYDDERERTCQKCTSSLALMIDHVFEQRTWAIMMADALVKPPTGLLSGTFSLVSNYDQCLKIPEYHTDEIENVDQKYPNLPEVIKGGYCSFKLRLKRNPKYVRENGTLSEFQQKMKSEEGQLDDVYKLQPEFPGFIGLCVPSACETEAFKSIGKAFIQTAGPILKSKMSKFPIIVGLDAVSCRTAETAGKIQLNFAGKLILGIFALLGILVVLGTVVDIVFSVTMKRDDAEKTELRKHSYEYQMQGDFLQMLRECSAGLSLRVLMNTNLQPNAIKCLNGIKFCAVFWLIMGNTGSLRAANMTTNMKEMQKALETVTTQFVLNKDLAVDTLFVVTGILLAFGLAKDNGAAHVLKYTAHRLIRTLPMYFLLTWFLICCFGALGDGPTWDIEKDRYLKNCGKYWWTNFALINNFFKVENQCIPHSWLVAMSTQGLVVAILARIFWKKSENITHFVLGALVVCTMIIDFFINLSKNLGPTTLLREYRVGSRNDYMSYVGMQLYSRGGPFFIGLIIGFIFNQKKNGKRAFQKLHKIPVAFMWLMILTVVVVSVNATFNWNRGTSSPSPSVAALYDAFHRVVFALGTGLLVMMCHAGKGGVINMLLSWPGFVPVSKLWLLIYLVHPFVIFHGNGTLRAPVYYTKKQLFTEIIWNFVVSLVVSILLHILLIAPFQAIERFFQSKFCPSDNRSTGSYTDSLGKRYKEPMRGDPEMGTGSSIRSSPSSLARDDKPEPYADHQRDVNPIIDETTSSRQQETEPLVQSSDVRNSLNEHVGTGSIYQPPPVDDEDELEIKTMDSSPGTLRKNYPLKQTI